MLDVIIRGGLVVTPEDVGERDIGIQDGKIVAVAWPGTLLTDTGRVIEAQGKIVLPGGIEPHAHIGIPVPEHWAGRPEVMTQPPEAASLAAAFGGGDDDHRLCWQPEPRLWGRDVPALYHAGGRRAA